MNEQLAIKRSMQLMTIFGTANSSKDLLDVEPNVRQGYGVRLAALLSFPLKYCFCFFFVLALLDARFHPFALPVHCPVLFLNIENISFSGHLHYLETNSILRSTILSCSCCRVHAVP